MFKIPYKKLLLWQRNKDGATAVEFSLVGIPFILMVIGIIEMALMFASQSLLEASTAEGARQIRTGAVQQGGGETLFQNTLCDYASIFIDCDDLQYQVVSIPSFEEAQNFPDVSFDDEGNLEDQTFDAGGVSDVVMIRTAFKYAIKTPMMRFILTNNSDGNRILLSTVVLQTEPYEFEEE